MAGRPAKRTDGQCLKCGDNPAIKGQSWCNGCFKDYHRSRQNIIAEQDEGRAFSRGVEAMVKTLADEFERFPGVKLTCEEAAAIVRQAPRPRLVRAGQ